MAVSYAKYLNFLKNRNIIMPCYKIELLDASENPYKIITNDIVASGSLSVKINNGIRRTASVTLSNSNNKYHIKPGELFYGTKLKLYAGIKVEEEDYYEPVGVFYIQSIAPKRGPNDNSIILSLVDKWGRLDGTIFGKIPDRVEFSKSVTVYKNTQVIYDNGVNTAALAGKEFLNNNSNFQEDEEYPLGSAVFTEATKGYNNRIKFTNFRGNFPSLKFKYPLSNFSLCFSGEEVNYNANILEIQLNNSHVANENIKIRFYGKEYIDSKTGEKKTRGKIKVNEEEEIDITEAIGELENIQENPLLLNKRITITYNNPDLSIYLEDKVVYSLSLSLPQKYYLYISSVGDDNSKSYPVLKIKDIYMDSTSFQEYFDYNIYQIIRSILKKSIRYDIKIISYLPSFLNQYSTSEEINQWLCLKIENLSSIVPERDCVAMTSDNSVLRCISNTKGVPQWGVIYIDNNDVIDQVEPLLDSYYEPIYLQPTGTGEYIIGDAENCDYVQVYDQVYKKSQLPYGILTLPKSITEEIGTTEGNILNNLAELLSAEVGYNRYGQFFLKPTEREISYQEQEVVWRFAYQDYYFNKQEQVNYSNIVNYVVITASIVDGGEISATATNEDTESEFCVQKVGAIPFIYKQEYAYDPSEWLPLGYEDKTDEEKRMIEIEEIRKNMKSLANWYLQRNKLLQSSVSITCSLIPHLEEGKIIELENENYKYDKYLINSFTIPFNYNGTMTIECTKVG